MRIFHSGKRQMAAFFVPGFLFGVLYMNLVAKKYMTETEIFSSVFLSKYPSVKIDIWSYLPYLLRLRLMPVIALAVSSFTRLRKAAAIFFLMWTGFTGGIALSLSADALGLKGSLLCAVSVLPQFLFYVPACVILLWYCLSAPRTQWNRQKTVFLVITMTVGILLELYINPALVREFISLFP